MSICHVIYGRLSGGKMHHYKHRSADPLPQQTPFPTAARGVQKWDKTPILFVEAAVHDALAPAECVYNLNYSDLFPASRLEKRKRIQVFAAHFELPRNVSDEKSKRLWMKRRTKSLQRRGGNHEKASVARESHPQNESQFIAFSGTRETASVAREPHPRYGSQYIALTNH